MPSILYAPSSALLLAVAGAAHADTVGVRSAELRVDEGEVLLNADFDFAVNATLEEALQKGIPLYFLLEFELTRSRWYWLDEKVAQTVDHVARVVQRADAAVRRAQRPAHADLQPLDEVERYIGRVTSRPVAQAARCEGHAV
jgi:hypothetical protein